MIYIDPDKPRTPDYWQQKAKEYQAAIEARSNLLITRETFVRRMCILRYTQAMSNDVRETNFFRRKWRAMTPSISEFVREHRIVKGVARVWVVCSFSRIHDEWTIEIHQKWEYYVMARAHADGRNYQYAKHLMTEERDKWTNELSGR